MDQSLAIMAVVFWVAFGGWFLLMLCVELIADLRTKAKAVTNEKK